MTGRIRLFCIDVFFDIVWKCFEYIYMLKVQSSYLNIKVDRK